jgi:hypothetical protein
MCLCYPQIGLWLIAFQQRGKRLRELLAMTAALKSMMFVALFCALRSAVTGNLSPGLRVAVLPFDDLTTLLMCLIPCWTLYADGEVNFDKDREEVRSVIVGCLSAALPCWGMELYWQVIPLQLALVPLSAFWPSPQDVEVQADKMA